MVKFSRQLEAQMIPEWRDAFVSYRQLKKLVKRVKLSFLRNHCTTSSDGTDYEYGFSLLDPIRSLASCYHPSPPPEDRENLYQLEVAKSRDDHVKDFFDKLEEELEKVNNFYRTKETEFCERGQILSKQLQILLDLKKILHDHHRRHRHCRSLQNSRSSSNVEGSMLSGLSPDSSFSEIDSSRDGTASPISDEIIAALERNGITFVGSAGAKSKKGLKPKSNTLRIDIPATNATKTISAVTAMIWEDIVNGSRKNAGDGEYINPKKIQCAEKMIRGAFMELYKGLNLLKKYSTLNMVAFTKILKKFHKVSNQGGSDTYLKKVKRSHFISSDKVVKLADDVESIFTKHFASNDRRKAMKFLRPQQPKDSDFVTFLVGLFTGTFVALFSVYAILVHLFGSLYSSTEIRYVETNYPVFSMFTLLSLHIFLYGCNLFMWKRTRINCNFIFEFSQSTALRHKDAFLICASFMSTVVTAMVIQLAMRSTGFSREHVNALPGILFLIYITILVCPFNVFYRSTRFCFLRVIRNIAFSPFYRVLMVDFFMADQLTSQVPLLRHLEFTACYFSASLFKTHPYETCTHSQQYKLLAYVISFLPYYWRAMQCIRRYIEEGYDFNHLGNAGKYVSAMIAAAARMKYAVDPTPTWLATVLFTSTMATCYQLYWDFVMDWGLFDLSSKNIWLRDELLLKNKQIYYASIAFNFVLRLAWIEAVMKINLGSVQHRLVDFLFASLEVIRRGHWNFYRLENEHLNNIGKFRAVKTVPLPFRDMESDG